jgi:hypothetical protein
MLFKKIMFIVKTVQNTEIQNTGPTDCKHNKDIVLQLDFRGLRNKLPQNLGSYKSLSK